MASTDTTPAGIDQLFSPCKRRFKTVTLPVRRATVRIQSLTEREVSCYQSVCIASGGSGLKRARLEDANRRLIVLCVVDGEGNRLLNDTHMEALSEWDGADTQFLYNECASHAGLRTDDIEGLVKNSEKANVVA